MIYGNIEKVCIIIVVILLLRIFKVYLEMFVSFMLNQENIQYDSRIEKPRLLFHILGILLIGVSFFLIKELNEFVKIDIEHVLLLFSSFGFYTLGVVAILFSWSKKFRNKYIPILEKKIKEKYKLKIKESVDIENYVKKFTETSTIDTESEKDLILFLNNEKVSSTIIWTAKTSRSKKLCYRSLFNFLDEVVEGGFMVKEQSRNIYHSLVTDNFIIEGVVFEKNVPPSYSFKGIKGIMEIFQCSKSKAMGIRACGIINTACIQNGNSFLVDRDLALALMKNKDHNYTPTKR